MATLLTIQQVRDHLQTALDDAALLRIMDASQQSIDQHCGTLAATTPPAYDPIVEYNYRSDGLPRVLLIHYPDTVTEVATVSSTGTETVLAEGHDQSYVIDGQYVRLIGDNATFGSTVKVTYVPRADWDRRVGTMLKLIDLELNAQPGQKFSGAATWQESYSDYETEKQRLLWELCPPPVFA